MSFDWLNVPGLNFNDNSSNPNLGKDGAAPPSVSFYYNQHLSNSNQQQQTQQQSPMVMPKKNNPFANYMQNSTTITNSSTPFNQYLPQKIDHSTTNINSSVQNNSSTAVVPFNGSNNYNEESYVETTEDLQVPLSLSQVQLSHEEMRTYLRWYKYITTRTHGKLVRLNDVFKFLSNFAISEKLKERIFTIFRTCKNALNIGQFFAVLRLISLAVCKSILPTRKMILEKATVPKPKPILNSQTDREVYEEVDEEEEENSQNKGEDSKVDFDSFTSLLLTGKSTRKRIRRKIKNSAYRNKKVRFSEHITFQEPSQENVSDPGINNKKTDDSNLSEDGPLDLSLPMDQLLKLMAERKKRNTSLVLEVPSEQQETEEEREELKDMQDSLSHFKQIRGPDSVSLIPPSYLGTNGFMGITAQQAPLQPLKPTSTGSANHFMRQEYNTKFGSQDSGPQQTLEPLKPTATGSANYLVRSQYSGNINTNTIASTTATNSNNNFNDLMKNDDTNQSSTQYQYSNISNTGNSNVPQIIEPLKPTATGSANYLMKKQINTINQTDMLPNEPNTLPQDSFMNFPQYRAEMQEYSQNAQPSQTQQIRQQQIPTYPLTQQSTYVNNSYSVLHSNQSSSPQHTMNNATNMLTQQSKYPTTEKANPTYLSPQHTAQQQQLQPTSIVTQSPIQNNNLLSASNVAGNYFQSLLSHTPSPNASNSTLPYQSNIAQQQQQQQQHTLASATTMPSRIPQQNTYYNSRNIAHQQIFNGSSSNNNNNGQFTYQIHNTTQPIQHTSNFSTNSQVTYNNQSPLSQQQAQQQKQDAQYLGNPGSQQNQMHIANAIQQSNPHNTYLGNTLQTSAPAMALTQQNTNQCQYLGAPNQLSMYGKSNSHNPAITGQSNNPISSASSSDTNILGNYQALQQQVNILQNRYR